MVSIVKPRKIIDRKALKARLDDSHNILIICGLIIPAMNGLYGMVNIGVRTEKCRDTIMQKRYHNIGRSKQ